MTALSLFADRRRAYLLSDGAQFDVRTGEVIGFAPKVLCFPSLSMAIGIQGWGTIELLMSALDAQKPAASRFGFLAVLPTALAGMRLQANLSLLSETRLWIAMFDRARRLPWMGTVQSGVMPDGQGLPYVIEPTEGAISGLSEADLREVHPSGWPVDPVEDGRRVLALQRRRPFPALAGGGIGVSGECGLYTVSATGVEYLPLLRFADKPGQRPDMSLEPERLG